MMALGVVDMVCAALNHMRWLRLVGIIRAHDAFQCLEALTGKITTLVLNHTSALKSLSYKGSLVLTMFIPPYFFLPPSSF